MARTLTRRLFLAMIIDIYYIFVYYILFFQFPLLMLIPPSPVSFYGNTIQSLVDFYVTVFLLDEIPFPLPKSRETKDAVVFNGCLLYTSDAADE